MVFRERHRAYGAFAARNDPSSGRRRNIEIEKCSFLAEKTSYLADARQPGRLELCEAIAVTAHKPKDRTTQLEMISIMGIYSLLSILPDASQGRKHCSIPSHEKVCQHYSCSLFRSIRR